MELLVYIESWIFEASCLLRQLLGSHFEISKCGLGQLRLNNEVDDLGWRFVLMHWGLVFEGLPWVFVWRFGLGFRIAFWGFCTLRFPSQVSCACICSQSSVMRSSSSSLPLISFSADRTFRRCRTLMFNRLDSLTRFWGLTSIFLFWIISHSIGRSRIRRRGCQLRFFQFFNLINLVLIIETNQRRWGFPLSLLNWLWTMSGHTLFPSTRNKFTNA